jgi:lysophospholipase L1-like esterase
MKHVVLLGDSILDNGAYVGGGPAVIEQVQARLAPDDHATQLAVDGDRVGDVARQLARLPRDTTHLLISAGGNDALDNVGILQQPASSIAQALSQLAAVTEVFAQAYRVMLEDALRHNLPTIVCTIYDANFSDATMQRVVKAALSHFNDAILREAFSCGVPVLDLRLMFNERADYANEIEPSSQGGEKIAAAIEDAITQHDFSVRRSAIFCGATA